MNRSFFIILISVFIFIGINTIFYFTIFNQQLDFQTDLLFRQTRLCGSTIEQGGLNFENELNAIPFAGEFGELFTDEMISTRCAENMQKLYARYSELINKITVFDNENNVYSLMLDRKGNFVTDYYESQEQTVLLDRDKLIADQDKYSLSIPDFDANGVARSNIVVEINFQRYVNSIFDKYRLENTLWQWMVTDQGVLMATADSDLNIPSNDLKRIGSDIIKGEEGSMIHAIHVEGSPTRVISVYYPIRLVKKDLGIIFSIKTDLFLRSIIRKISIISLLSLALVGLLLYIYFTVFHVKSETVRRKRVSEVALIKTLDSLPVGIILAEPSGAIRVMNRTAREWIMKDPKDSPENRTLHEMDLDLQVMADDPLYTRAFGPGSMVKLHSESSIRQLYQQEFLTEINQVETSIIMLFDISEFEKARNLEKIAQLAKSELLENMSHEIAGPVSQLRDAAAILEKEGLSGKVKNTVISLKKTIELLSNQITSILDFSMQDVGKVIMEEIPFSFREEIDLAIQPFISAAAQTNSSIITKIRDDMPDKLVGDPFRLRQILYNLVESSVELTRGGRILLSAEAIEHHDEYLVIQFQIDDTGSGLPRQIIDKFTSRQGNSLDMSGKGFEENELRMAIALQHINLLRGQLWIESPSSISPDPDHPGTKYSFTIEVLESMGNEKEDLQAKDADKAAGTKGIDPDISILLAEDNIFNRKLAQNIFKSLGFEIDLAENGKEAVKMAGEKSYDIIFMDLLMPEMDGLQAITEIRKMGFEVPVVAVTAVENPDTRSAAEALSIEDYLLKPATVDQIKEILIRIFPKNAAED